MTGRAFPDYKKNKLNVRVSQITALVLFIGLGIVLCKEVSWAQETTGGSDFGSSTKALTVEEKNNFFMDETLRELKNCSVQRQYLNEKINHR